jgi:hypothetical protein
MKPQDITNQAREQLKAKEFVTEHLLKIKHRQALNAIQPHLQRYYNAIGEAPAPVGTLEWLDQRTHEQKAIAAIEAHLNNYGAFAQVLVSNVQDQTHDMGKRAVKKHSEVRRVR